MRRSSTLLSVALAVSAPVSIGRAPSQAPVHFQSYDLKVPSPARQDAVAVQVVPGGPKHLVVALVDAHGAASLAVFPPLPQGGFASEPSQVRSLPAEVVALDKGSGGKDQPDSLYLLGPKQVWRWDPGSASLVEVAETHSIYQGRPEKTFLPIEFMQDADGDGDDDIVLPDFDGYQISFQGPPGEFSKPQFLKLPVITHYDEYNRRVPYQAVPLSFADMDLDDKLDGTSVRDDVLYVFKLNPGGKQANGDVRRPLGLGIGERSFRDEVGEVDQRNQTWKYLVRIDDFDGDGVADLLTHTVKSSGVFDKKHTLDLYRGERSEGTIVYPPAPSTHIESAVVVEEPTIMDINGDGKLDLAVGSVDFGLGTLLRMLVTGSVNVEVGFYPMNDEKGYDESPAFNDEAKIEVDLSSGRPTIPVARLADINGDGHKDLVIGSGSENQLRIYIGNGRPSLFESKPILIDVRLPRNGGLLGVEDVNGDGKEDLLVRYAKLDGQDLERTVRVLISQ